MRGAIGMGALIAAVAFAGCGGSDGGSSGDVIVTDRALADSLAVAANRQFEDRGFFGTSVGQEGGRCEGADARWTCTLDVDIESNVGDRRTYAVSVDAKGCWAARQTGTDVGRVGQSHRPSHPGRLRGCIK